VYFLFLTEDNSYDITNKIISLAFLVFVVYNFLNMRGLKGEIENLTEQNATLMEKLTKTKGALKQTQADLETVKSDLVVAQTENEKRKAEVDTLKAALSAKD
jgi:predicted nuclease with TOPRIM domain